MDFRDEIEKLESAYKFLEALELYRENRAKLNTADRTLMRFGQILFDFQMYDEAKSVFEEIVEKVPENIEYIEKLGIIEEELGNRENAIIDYKLAGKIEKAKEIQNLEDIKKSDPKLIDKMIDLFCGREDTFALQNETGYFPVRRVLSQKDMKKHLNGERTIGIYQLRCDNTIKFAAYDIDIKKNSTYDIEGAKYACNQIKKNLAIYKINFYTEFSGNKGYHIWIFFESFVQSYKIKAIMENIIDDIEFPDSIGIEIFPKQIDVGQGLGNLIKIPLGIHKKSEKRCLFVDNEYCNIINQSEYTLNIKKNKVENILNLYSENIKFENTVKKVYKNRKKESKLKEKLRQNLLQNQNKDKIKTLIKNCYILNQIEEKIERFAFVEEEEEYILMKSIFKLDGGKIYLKELLKKTINFNEKRYESIMQGDKETLITCEEIKRLIASKKLKLDISKCNCKFAGGYNSPYGYIYDLENIYIEDIGIDEILKKIIEKNAIRYEVEKDIGNLKKIVNKKMGDKNELKTEYGLIRKKDDEIDIIM